MSWDASASLDPAGDVPVVERAPVVPLRVEGLRVDLAERQVVAEPQQGLGQQDVVLRVQHRRRRRIPRLPREVLEQRLEVVCGIEPVRCAVGDGAAQLRGILRVSPGGSVGAARVEVLDQLLERNVRALDAVDGRIHQRLELHRDRRCDRVGNRARGLRNRRLRWQQGRSAGHYGQQRRANHPHEGCHWPVPCFASARIFRCSSAIW